METEKNVPNFGTNQELAEHIEEIFRERDSVYAERERLLELQKRELQREENSIEKEREAIEAERQLLQGEREQVLKEQEVLRKLSGELDAKKAELESKSAAFIQDKLQLEKTKNQQLLLQNEKEKLEQECRNLRAGTYPSETGVSEEELEEKYILKDEHFRLLEEQRAENSILQEEKQNLLKQLMKQQKPAEPSAETAEETHIQRKVVEELTAQILKNYLVKNDIGFEDLEIFHTEGKNQLYAKRGNLEYRFIFENPCYFDVSVERKDGRKLKGVIDLLNQQHQDIKFFAREGRATATSYFSPGLPAYELIKEVETVSELFRG